MRHRSLFAALRGKDGRSLARALIVLVLVGLFAGSINTGASAGDGVAALCSVDMPGDSPDAPRHDEPDCCMLGLGPFGLALAAAPPAVALPVFASLPDRPRPSGLALDGPGPFRATARGPPLDA